jgi:hypothetical protein
VVRGLRPIGTSEIVEGYEYEGDKYVLLDPNEVDAIKLDTKTKCSGAKPSETKRTGAKSSRKSSTRSAKKPAVSASEAKKPAPETRKKGS